CPELGQSLVSERADHECNVMCYTWRVNSGLASPRAPLWHGPICNFGVVLHANRAPSQKHQPRARTIPCVPTLPTDAFLTAATGRDVMLPFSACVSGRSAR